MDGLDDACAGGTAAGACPTARASRTGRSPRWCGSAPASSRARSRTTARAKLHAPSIEHFVPTTRSERFVEPRLAHLLGLEDRTGPRPATTCSPRGACSSNGISEQRPVVLVFEDLQWADPSLLEFIDHLLEWSRSRPIFVLDARPARARTSATRLGAPDRHQLRSRWSRSSEQAMDELLDGFVPGLPTELASTILARAEGVPLYAVETVRMLLDRGLLVAGGRRLPADRRGRRRSRSRRRSTPHRRPPRRPRTARSAGCSRTQPCSARPSRSDALAALSGISRATSMPLLAALVRKEVLGVQADPRSPERGQYGFLQDLVRRVAYETLVSARPARTGTWPPPSHLERSVGASEGGDRRGRRLALPGGLRGRTPTPTTRREIKARARELLVASRRARRIARRAGRGATLLRAGGGARGRAGRARPLLLELRERHGLEQRGVRARPNRACEAGARAPHAGRARRTRRHASIRTARETRSASPGAAEQGMRRMERRLRRPCRRTSPTTTSPSWRRDLAREPGLRGRRRAAPPSANELALGHRAGAAAPETLVRALGTKA